MSHLTNAFGIDAFLTAFKHPQSPEVVLFLILNSLVPSLLHLSSWFLAQKMVNQVQWGTIPSIRRSMQERQLIAAKGTTSSLNLNKGLNPASS
jgi:hypothetical protein